MNIVFLDCKTIGDDIDLSPFSKLGEVITYEYSTPKEAALRAKEADVLVINKVPMNEETLADAKKLRLVCVTATGTNNLDKEYLDKRGIAWRNVAGYSTECVAQHTFAMLFYLWENLAYYDAYVKGDKYLNDKSFSHFEKTFHELSGKEWGIIGLGAIGRRVAEIATCFGAKVSYYSTSGNHYVKEYPKKSLEELLAKSDIISLHCPLTEKTEKLIGAKAFLTMKKSAILINVARGAVVDEAALADALENGWIAAAGIDVLTTEPMTEDQPLRRIKDSGRLLITPHIGWAGIETRQRLMHTICGQIQEVMETGNL